MDKYFEIVFNYLINNLDDHSAYEFVCNELSFGATSSLKVRNFIKSSGVILQSPQNPSDFNELNIFLTNYLLEIGAFQTTIDLRLRIVDAVMEKFSIGKYSNLKEKASIKFFSEKTGISNLIHFTKIENIPSIVDIGINSIDFNNEIYKSHFVNDQSRFDYRTNTISVSLSYPNDKMLYKYRKMQPNQQWAVLTLMPDILWELECLFCWQNAASSSISRLDKSELYGLKALRRMFHTDNNFSVTPYPKDSQAEVLVINHIPPRYVKEIFVEKKSDYLDGVNIPFFVDSFYFNNRDYILSKA
ncbi:DarT ssDNA thymidine ADP-ribosyltransferase family protein [Rheinheimera texasensis]|uniref:DarT ssDNA thymidine ADP-ribosyltransferase family protein n=1 Tax=Rheinheimera texasensis TaxID=306205 RepID=UPI0004E0F85A|nr:DarT ssDNA thymidine ADP-ribosyltransferase family protein [Rheinheimera texasensis]